MHHAISQEHQFPHELMVVDENGYHYPETLNALAGAIVAQIAQHGFTRPAIAILGSHGLAMIAAAVAALARGTRILFLDPASHSHDLAPFLEALEITVLINASESPGPVFAGVVVVDALSLQRTTDPTAASTWTPLQFDLLTSREIAQEYAVLTSGTTGQPKIILQTIRNLRAHIANYLGYTDIVGSDRILQVASAGWDAGLMDIFSCIWTGATLCSFDPRKHDLYALGQFIEKADPDVLHITVPLYRLLHRERNEAYPTSKRVVLGGEIIHRADLELFDRVFPPGSTLFNAYGPTECTTALYASRLQGAPIVDAVWSLSSKVDKVTVRLENDGQAICSHQEHGELIIQSPLVARHLDLSSGLITELSVPRQDGGEGYATGDLARYDEYGGIVITGRNDSMIKVNGQKVNLSDIESELRKLEYINDTCVIARPVAEGSEIVGAIVPKRADFDVRVLRRHLANRLPGHKMLKRILVLSALPLNSNNKIDRKALAELASQDALKNEASGPLDADTLARTIKASLSDLPLDPILSFRENGGDSLRAISVLANLKRLGLRLGLSELLSDLPIRDLEALIREVDTIGAPSALLDAGTCLPNRGFLEKRSIPDLDRWSQSLVFDYGGSLETVSLREVVAAVLRRHSSLFPNPGELDVSLISGTSHLDALNEVSSRISWSSGRRGSAAIIENEGKRHIAMAFHQFCIDRISWTLLEGEFEEAERQGLSAMSFWPKPSIDYTAWAQLYSQTRGKDFAPTFWSSLGFDRCGELVPAGVSFPPRSEFSTVRLSLRRFFQDDFGRAESLQSVSDTLLSAILLGLSTLTGSSMQKIDLLSHGRDIEVAGTDNLDVVGWFTVIYPLVVQAGEGDDPFSVLQAIKAYNRSVAGIAHTFGNQFYAKSGRRVGSIPQCQASYNFLGDIAAKSGNAFSINPISLNTMHGSASHFMEFTGYIESGRPVLLIEYNRSLFSSESLQRLSHTIEAAIDEFAGVRSQ